MTDERTNVHLPHVLSEEGVRAVTKIRGAAIEFEQLLNEIPNPRYRALARTAIEESVMWAVKGHSIPE